MEKSALYDIHTETRGAPGNVRSRVIYAVKKRKSRAAAIVKIAQSHTRAEIRRDLRKHFYQNYGDRLVRDGARASPRRFSIRTGEATRNHDKKSRTKFQRRLCVRQLLLEL